MRLLRHGLLGALLSSLVACSGIMTTSVTQDLASASGSFFDLNAVGLDGTARPLSEFRGQVVLVVNTASKCGFTPQYEALQSLQEEFGGEGFTVLGFPSADFGGQEFATAGEISNFCEQEFGVTFPLFSKIKVKEGVGQSPVFEFLGKATGSLPGWNFGKYLVDRDGRVVSFYPTPVAPDGKKVRAAIERALKQGQ